MTPRHEFEKEGDLNKRTLSNLQFLDSLLRMGEEPYEIETTVSMKATETGEAFKRWLEAKGMELPEGMIETTIPYFFAFVYLDHWSRRASLHGITVKQLEEFLAIPLEAVGYEVLAVMPITHFELMLLFYRFLNTIGYNVPLAKIEKTINASKRAAERELKKRPIQNIVPTKVKTPDKIEPLH